MAPSPGAPPSPEELFVRWRDGGDSAAMADLFEAEAPVLFRTAVAICSDPGLAEEAVQETFLTAMQSAHRWDDGRRTGPWLTGILRIKILELRRRGARRPDPGRLPPPPSPEDPVVASAMAEDVERVRAAIRRLPEPYRAVALLRWCHGLEPADIADLRGEPPGTVWSLLSRAMARLRRDLGALAVLAPLFPAERGLDGIREVVLAEARRPRPSGAAAGPAVTGPDAPSAPPAPSAPLPAARLPVVLAAGATLAVLGGVVLARGGARPAPVDLRPGRPATAADAAPAAEARAPSSPGAPGPPPPVDLAACDRDLDLFGTVVDGTGAAVAGATVRTFHRPFGDVFFLDIDAARVRTPGPVTETAEDGTFRVRLPRGATCDVRVSSGGRGEAEADWRMAGERVRLVLRHLPSLTVTATDLEGAPLEGVRVSPSRPDETRRTTHLAVAVTNGAGRCTLPSLRPGRWWLQFEHPRHRAEGPALVEVPERGDVSHVERLAPGRMAAGRVEDARTGSPLEGILVGEGPYFGHGVVSGADGGFLLPLHPDGARTFLVAKGSVYSRAIASAEPDGRWRAALTPGAAAEGRLLQPSGTPATPAVAMCVGASVPVPGRAMIDSAACPVDGEGRFRLEGLTPGAAYTLVAEVAGAGRLLREFLAPADPEGVADLGDILLPPSRRIEGVVVDEAGEPVADHPVVLRSTGNLPAGAWMVTDVARRTDDLGRFRFADRAPGTYRLAAEGSGDRVAAGIEVSVPHDADVTGLVLPLPAGVEVPVRVESTAGGPVPGALLTLSGGDHGTRVLADGAGRARLRLLPGETVRAHVMDPSSTPRLVAAAPAGTPVAAGGGEVRLLLRPAAMVRGTVLSSGGASSARTWVGCRDPRTDGTWGAWTGSDGRFELLAPEGVPLEAWARSGSFVRTAVSVVVAPADAVLLVVPEVGDRTLRIRVEDPEGRPVRGARLAAPATRAGGAPATDRSGAVTLARLGPAPLTLSVLYTSALPAGLVPGDPVTVLPDGSTVVLRLVRGMPVAGEVHGTDGRPAAGATVSLATAEGHRLDAAADGEGRFLLWIGPADRVLHAIARGRTPEGRPASRSLEGAAATGGSLQFFLRED